MKTAPANAASRHTDLTGNKQGEALDETEKIKQSVESVEKE